MVISTRCCGSGHTWYLLSEVVFIARELYSNFDCLFREEVVACIFVDMQRPTLGMSDNGVPPTRPAARLKDVLRRWYSGSPSILSNVRELVSNAEAMEKALLRADIKAVRCGERGRSK